MNKFNHPVKPYTTVAEFVDDFLSTAQKIVEERIKTLNVGKVAVDLSSGFDCTLVAYILHKIKDIDLNCYSRVSNLALDDTHPDVMIDFAKLHNLKVKILQADDIYPFSDAHDLNWTKEYFFPSDHGQELYYQHSQIIAEDNNQIRFTGDGGDEIYHSSNGTELEKYPIQLDYFNTVMGLKWDIDAFFSAYGLEQLLDRERFAKKKAFPSYSSPSAVSMGLLFFPILWELNLWNISPLTDPRLIQIARRIPLRNDEPMTREEIWATRPDIFAKSQFRYKGHFGKHVGQFLIKKPQIVIDILENSILGKMGIIKSEEIIENIKNGNIAKYLDKPLIILHNILRLEYFLQQNHIS